MDLIFDLFIVYINYFVNFNRILVLDLNMEKLLRPQKDERVIANKTNTRINSPSHQNENMRRITSNIDLNYRKKTTRFLFV